MWSVPHHESFSLIDEAPQAPVSQGTDPCDSTPEAPRYGQVDSHYAVGVLPLPPIGVWLIMYFVLIPSGDFGWLDGAVATSTTLSE